MGTFLPEVLPQTHDVDYYHSISYTFLLYTALMYISQSFPRDRKISHAYICIWHFLLSPHMITLKTLLLSWIFILLTN